jgi:hypothetical protein
MQLRNSEHALDAYRPTFDPHLDIATVVFSHVQCVKTRVNLALVSKLWLEASKPAAAYPLRFDFDAFPDTLAWKWRQLITRLLDNDEALSLPYERVVGLLGEAAKNVCDHAARLGSVRLLKWTRENNLAWSEDTCTYAAMNGQLPALQYLHENGCPWDSSTCMNAAAHGQLPALQYLHENGCPWDWETCSFAAYDGHLFVLQYLHENGCPWDENTYSSAAAKGHLPALKYLHENGCPWDEYTCDYAADNKHWDCVQYLVDNKCPGWEEYAEEYAEHLR